MKLKNAVNDVQSMSQDGDAILRSLQNKSLPVIDLLVRESLQNSLDATLIGKKETKVDFLIGKFNSPNLANHFEGITQRLTSRFDGTEEFIAIKDRNTSGLTGDYRANDARTANKSNFFKLVFGIGKNQEAEGAGGSWGLGKTSYFRLGIGIVIYYTRVETENGFEERLIASLIESPKQKNRLLPANGRGIAWWGDFEENNLSQLLPITDGEEISKFLEIFNIERYKDDETGTTIIVPYLGRNEMFAEVKDEEAYPWEQSREDAVKIAVQRWYIPRLMNENYSAYHETSLLNCTVNGKGFVKGYNTEPTFDVFQDLYSSALIGKAINKDIEVKPVFLKRNSMKEPSKNPVGNIAFIEVNKVDMQMISPNNKFSPLEYIGVKDEQKIELNNSKIIAYSRKPGMIVEYNVDGEWSPKSNIQKENHNLLGFFVPNSNGELIDKIQEIGYKNLEQYLRATENADHANWIDEDGIRIIQRIHEYTSKIINDHFVGETEEKQTSATSGLSRKFGKLLLPPKNYGKTSSRKGTDPKNKINVGKRNRISDIRVLSSNPISENIVDVDFNVSIQKKSANRIFLQILTQEKKIEKKEWKEKISEHQEFPFEIENLFINTVEGKKYDVYYEEFKDPEISFEQLGDKSEIRIYSNTLNPIVIEGKLTLKIKTSDFIPNIAISSEIKQGDE
ncbi:hypothetical protein P3U62_00630 [Mammaliicoccus vitulinus]|uniref:hypothetical protein n=1 Tax=Mammaliicoccus vitulinus TaxID=71237 RepID=UPI002B257A54|nr:hypothetical protein [Mammaliicoccus vitulinus]WQK88069.1 hypothetical protein P3U62_00630 [Mammaliicoccus vitulinus]